jgi:hypothetical protein
VKLKAHSSPQRTLKIETTDTGILLGNKEDFHSIYSIAFGLAHPIVSHSPDTVRFSPNSLIQPSNPSEINRTIDSSLSPHHQVFQALKHVHLLFFYAFLFYTHSFSLRFSTPILRNISFQITFPVFLLLLLQCLSLVCPLSSPPSSSNSPPGQSNPFTFPALVNAKLASRERFNFITLRPR